MLPNGIKSVFQAWDWLTHRETYKPGTMWGFSDYEITRSKFTWFHLSSSSFQISQLSSMGKVSGKEDWYQKREVQFRGAPGWPSGLSG